MTKDDEEESNVEDEEANQEEDAKDIDLATTKAIVEDKACDENEI